jgi:hypothetical protein
MKSLSVKPQYVRQMLAGQKTIELRSWPTKHRGPLLICATQPDGHARCVAEVLDCRPFAESDARAACSLWRPGLYAWVLGSVREIVPFRVRGMLSLFPTDDTLIHELDAAEREVPLPPLPIVGMVVAEMAQRASVEI